GGAWAPAGGGGWVSVILRAVSADGGAWGGEGARSTTDWTVVRPPRLQNKPVTGSYRTVVAGFPLKGRFIGRADVAHAMLAMINDPGTVKQGVGVAY
ncbi:NAD(P)H-binding protein, partial [Streptomyces sp. NPDC127044]